MNINPIKLSDEQLNKLPLKDLLNAIDEAPCLAPRLTFETVCRIPKKAVEYLSRKHADISGWLHPVDEAQPNVRHT